MQVVNVCWEGEEEARHRWLPVPALPHVHVTHMQVSSDLSSAMLFWEGGSVNVVNISGGHDPLQLFPCIVD